MARRRPAPVWRDARRHLAPQAVRQQRPRQLAKAQRGAEEPRARQRMGKERAPRALERPAAGFRFNDGAADVDQPPIAHPRGTGRLAGAAGETAVEVQPRLVGDLLPLERLLHEVNAAARAVVLVAEEQIGRTGRGAEATVHALAQDGVGLASFRRVADEIGQSGLHQGIPVTAPGTSARG